MGSVIALFSGLVFGLGLIASGMTDPGKVQGFLDLFGAWDPSLGLVMGGAVAVAMVAFASAKRRTRSWTGSPIEIPTSRVIDRRLVFGGLLFGAGWGLAGYCPGPALVAASGGSAAAAVFVLAMLAGMRLHDRWLAPR
ncbi:MAG: YeeE/YedE family protein [Burkholderiales bacterium]|nr:YeeE/YedE family protein [Burkholderiales bacterium]